MGDERDSRSAVPVALRGDAEVFRQAMRRHAGGVAVVTVAGPDGPHGLTVTSLTAASLHPPLVSFYVNREARCWPALSRATHVGVHLLGAEHRDLAALFARRGADRYSAPTRWWPGPRGVPQLLDVAVRMVCARREIIPVGDHFLVVAEVLDTEHARAEAPLLYAYGEFGRWAPLGASAVVSDDPVPDDALTLDDALTPEDV